MPRTRPSCKGKSFHAHSSLLAASIDISVNWCSVSIGSGGGGTTSATGSTGLGGLVFMTLNTTMKPNKPRRTLAKTLKRGIHICHLDGLVQKSFLAGVQTGGGVSGSVGVSVKRPISERLPLIVSRLVVILRLCRSECYLCMRECFSQRAGIGEV